MGLNRAGIAASLFGSTQATNRQACCWSGYVLNAMPCWPNSAAANEAQLADARLLEAQDARSTSLRRALSGMSYQTSRLKRQADVERARRRPLPEPDLL